MIHAKTKRLSRILRILVDIILVLNLIALILLPFLLKLIYDQPVLFEQLERIESEDTPDIRLDNEYPADLPPESYPFYLGFLYVSGICTAWLLLEGHLILRRVADEDPFHARQGRSFRHMAIALFILSLTFGVKIIVYITLLTIFCAIVFFILGFVALLLADLFHQAWQVKSENELTI
ncbi:MAG: DUF2975 domain-containing protein [Bacillota bacterium]|nr:DUF2975 domain-containing protein [Bacillota bacterium]